jgi:hypothetical protein
MFGVVGISLRFNCEIEPPALDMAVGEVEGE